MYKYRSVHLVHEHGKKEYRLIYIRKEETDRALCIRRWGKVGTWGQIKITRGTPKEAEAEFQTMLDQKLGRGYRSEDSVNEIFADTGELWYEMIAYTRSHKNDFNWLTGMLYDNAPHSIIKDTIPEPESSFEETYEEWGTW